MEGVEKVEEEEEASSIVRLPCGSVFLPSPLPLTSRHLATSLKGRLLPTSQRSAGLHPGPLALLDPHVTRRLGGASQQPIDPKHLRLLLVEPSVLKQVFVSPAVSCVLRPRAQARNPGVEADGSAHQPGQP